MMPSVALRRVVTVGLVSPVIRGRGGAANVATLYLTKQEGVDDGEEIDEGFEIFFNNQLIIQSDR